MAIQICVPIEAREDKQRMALVPDVIKRLISDDIQISIQTKTGEHAGFFDSDYESANIGI